MHWLGESNDGGETSVPKLFVGVFVIEGLEVADRASRRSALVPERMNVTFNP
tara:strand:- start:17012 stop:17167 length:156 start_codon:yes stop_codon:yes gene_type:complete